MYSWRKRQSSSVNEAFRGIFKRLIDKKKGLLQRLHCKKYQTNMTSKWPQVLFCGTMLNAHNFGDSQLIELRQAYRLNLTPEVFIFDGVLL